MFYIRNIILLGLTTKNNTTHKNLGPKFVNGPFEQMVRGSGRFVKLHDHFKGPNNPKESLCLDPGLGFRV